MEGGESIMQLALTLTHMYPGAKFDVVQYADGTLVIEKWEHTDPQPTLEEVEAYWTENEQEITESIKPSKTELEILKETVDQLVLDNLMR